MGLKTESDTMRGNSMGDEIQIRDTRDGGWFWADNELIDHYGETIGVHGIAVYMALARYANNNKCWPSIGTICKKIGVSRPTVTKALNKLKAAGLISVQHRMTAEGDSDSNLYTLERIKVGRQGDLLRVGKEVGDGRQGGLHKQDLPNKTNSNNFGEGKAPSPSGGGKAPPPELPSKAKTTSARKSNGKNKLRGDLEQYFAEISNIPLPKCETEGQRKAAAKRWWNPLAEILEMTDWNLTQAQSLVNMTYKQMKKDELTIAAPQSILSVAISLHADGRVGANGKRTIQV